MHHAERLRRAAPDDADLVCPTLRTPPGAPDAAEGFNERSRRPAAGVAGATAIRTARRAVERFWRDRGDWRIARPSRSRERRHRATTYAATPTQLPTSSGVIAAGAVEHQLEDYVPGARDSSRWRCPDRQDQDDRQGATKAACAGVINAAPRFPARLRRGRTTRLGCRESSAGKRSSTRARIAS